MSKQKTTEQFISDSIKIHGNKYDYSKTIYTKALNKVLLICPIHGEFEICANSHLNGRGCKKCGIEKSKETIKETLKHIKKTYHKNKKKTTEEFIEEARKVHGDKYDYSKVNYINNHTKVIITCPIHGDFEMTPSNHLNGQNCKYCSYIQKSITKTSNKEKFIEKANIIHCNFYNYDKVIYTKARKKVIITCPIHGDFEMTPDNHLKGCGCQRCQNSKLENDVRKLLLNNNIQFIEYYKPFWLKCDDGIHTQSLDFYLPEYNIAIECQGKQHFGEYGTFGSKTKSSEELYNEILERDIRKNFLCKKNNVELLYFTKIKNIDNYIFPIINDDDELLKMIKK